LNGLLSSYVQAEPPRFAIQLRNLDGVIHLDAEVENGAFYLSVPEQDTARRLPIRDGNPIQTLF